jgi:hypothetical protein
VVERLPEFLWDELGTQFACFTSTNTGAEGGAIANALGTQFACFTSTKVQILTQKAVL